MKASRTEQTQASLKSESVLNQQLLKVVAGAKEQKNASAKSKTCTGNDRSATFDFVGIAG